MSGTAVIVDVDVEVGEDKGDDAEARAGTGVDGLERGVARPLGPIEADFP